MLHCILHFRDHAVTKSSSIDHAPIYTVYKPIMKTLVGQVAKKGRKENPCFLPMCPSLLWPHRPHCLQWKRCCTTGKLAAQLSVDSEVNTFVPALIYHARLPTWSGLWFYAMLRGIPIPQTQQLIFSNRIGNNNQTWLLQDTCFFLVFNSIKISQTIMSKGFMLFIYLFV